jgi:uncharacterized protein (TIGR02598 family)
MNRRRPFSHLSGFSLVEVVVALGIVSFAVVALIGLLPAGLNAQRQAASRARCIQALSAVSDAARAIYVATNGSTNYAAPLDGLTPGAAGTTTYAFLDDGSLTNNAVTENVQGRVFVEQFAPPANHDLIPLHISVAWPASATRSAGAWQNAQGSVESLVFVNPP